MKHCVHSFCASVDFVVAMMLFTVEFEHFAQTELPVFGTTSLRFRCWFDDGYSTGFQSFPWNPSHSSKVYITFLFGLVTRRYGTSTRITLFSVGWTVWAMKHCEFRFWTAVFFGWAMMKCWLRPFTFEFEHDATSLRFVSGTWEISFTVEFKRTELSVSSTTLWPFRCWFDDGWSTEFELPVAYAPIWPNSFCSTSPHAQVPFPFLFFLSVFSTEVELTAVLLQLCIWLKYRNVTKNQSLVYRSSYNNTRRIEWIVKTNEPFLLAIVD